MTQEKPFVNSFWGQKDGGLSAIQIRIKTSLRTLHELLEYYKERISIEKEYNKRLGKLASSVTLGSEEIGSLKIALDKLQGETKNMVAQNHTFICSVSVQNYEKLYGFYKIYEKNTSKIQAHILKVCQRKTDLKKYLESAKEKFRAACGQQKSLTLLCQTTWGKELEKNTAKLQKVQQNMYSLESTYHQAVHQYTEIHEMWVRDWSIALSNIYQLEIERIQICKLNCFAFCNNVASLCVDWDSAVDNARNTFAKVAAPKDVYDFVLEYGTGSQIAKPPKTIDFLNGFDDQEGETYTSANFQDPDYSHILSRTFSTHSNVLGHVTTNTADVTVAVSPGQGPGPAAAAPFTPIKPIMNKSLPPIHEPLSFGEGDEDEREDDDGYLGLDLGGGTNTHKRKSPRSQSPNTNLQKNPSQHSNYTSSSKNTHDMFDRGEMSDYSSPTTYSSNTGRSWSSPRKKSAQELQAEINRRSRTLCGSPPQTKTNNNPTRPPVSLVKDFSIDFMAKALEDLNAGGDGDMNKFRRSVRAQNVNPSVPGPVSDFIDDSEDTARRLDSIVFRTPKNVQNQQRPVISSLKTVNSGESTIVNFNAADDHSLMTVKKTPKECNKRSLSQSPTKGYKNLQAFVGKTTPVTRNTYETKAIAKYTYSASEQGELSFKKGWHMYVIHKQEDKWYICELGDNCGDARGAVGLVPYNYVVEGDMVF